MKKQLRENKERNINIPSQSPNNHDDSSPVPKEIDIHFKLYGKHIWEVKYHEKCEICNSHFDEFGFCACGSVND